MLQNKKIFTIPNVITLGRLVLLPFFLFALCYNKTTLAILLFTAIALSDMLDGLSAKITKQETKIGSLLDSTTDLLILFSTLITLLFIKKYISIYMIIILIIPIIIISIAKLVYIKKRGDVSPTIIGKITVAFAYLTSIALLINFEYKTIFLIATTIFVYATMIAYIIKILRLLHKF